MVKYTLHNYIIGQELIALSEPLTYSILCVCEERGLWRRRLTKNLPVRLWDKQQISMWLIISIPGLSYLFLVGGFAESSMLQHEIRKDFGQILKVIIPQGVDTIIVKGKNENIGHWIWVVHNVINDNTWAGYFRMFQCQLNMYKNIFLVT